MPPRKQMKRPTLAQLQAQRNALVAKASALKKVEMVSQENKKLQKEIRELKNPGTTAFKKNIKSGMIKGGRATLRYLDDITRPVPMRRLKKRKR